MEAHKIKPSVGLDAPVPRPLQSLGVGRAGNALQSTAFMLRGSASLVSLKDSSIFIQTDTLALGLGPRLRRD